MKKLLLNRHLRVVAFFLLCLLSSVAYAQQPPQPCHITITSDFESQCLLPLKDDRPYDEEPETIIACQENTVTYTASTNTGGVPVVQWNWSVAGALTWIDHGNGSITVTWGTYATGQITVEITTANDYTCTTTQNVKLIEKPTIYVSTIPNYVETQNHEKIITVCKGETVEFTDLSSTTNSDIVGYYWECDDPHIISSTPNFRVENVVTDCKVTHRVYNNCGCYDEDVYIIKVREGEILDLGCYGTVCQNTKVTYTALAPPCDQYSWYVEGGTIQGSNDQQTVTVLWNHPQNGYGIIGLDGVLCGEIACPSLMTKKIPIIEDTIDIKGQDIACVDEAVIYSIPLYGSTRYTWDIQPNAGVDVYEVNGANQKTVVFRQPGTYQITVSYECEFLECGEFTSKPLIVEVKPKLAINGEERICITNACDLKTEPIVHAMWRVYDIDNNDQLIHTANNLINFSYNFPHAGKYRVTAEHPDFCRPAVFVITVVDAPPTPVASDFDPTNPHVACPNSGILLRANPAIPDYTIVWEPTCNDATPDMVSGNSVTIDYQNTVCDINAYNYDRVLGCLSATPYVHTVSAFQLAGHTLPTSITVCPGAEVPFSVQNQSGVIYEWELQSSKQFCASLQGDKYSNAIMLLVNEIPTPEVFYLKLKRVYCSNMVDYHTITVYVRDDLDANLSINDPGPICQYSTVQLSGTGCNNNSYEWNIEDDVHHGNPVNHTFNHSGDIPVTMKCNPYYSCPNSNYYATETRVVHVIPAPPVTSLGFTGMTSADNVYVNPSLSTSTYSFSWGHTGTNNNIVSMNPLQNMYTCTVTDNTTGCSKTVSAYRPCPNALTVTATPYDYCSRQVSLSAIGASDPVTWIVTGGDYSVVSKSGNFDENITLSINSAGHYTVTARIPGIPCSAGSYSFTVDFVPNFTFEKVCNKIIIHNKSSYLNGNKLVGITYNSTQMSFHANQGTIQLTLPDGTYTFRLNSFGGVSINPPCTLETVTVENSSNSPVNITMPPSSPQYQACDNTPIQLTASIQSPHTIALIDWNFDDGSSISNRNPVRHTFEATRDYTVVATVTDENLCKSQGTVHVHSNPNILKPENLILSGVKVCEGTPRKLSYSINAINDIAPSGMVSYIWDFAPPTSNPYNYKNVSSTGDYGVVVTNPNYCEARKSRNVSFYNIPIALIVTASSIYCEGETIKFYGSPDPNPGNYTFLWEITDLDSGTMDTYTSADVSYTPTHAGTYTVSLTITNNYGCSDNAFETIVVNPTPQEPSIFYNGNKCLHEGAVQLGGTTGTTPESIINWSNGNTGPDAYYYTPGIAQAWYYDINTGCKSKEAKIHIEAQPDFDALLTGCYKKCERFFVNHPTLPVWGLSSGIEYMKWEWNRDNNTQFIDGNTVYPQYFLSLPLTGFDNYNLNLLYNTATCGPLVSPTLTIEYKDTCDCEDLDVSYEYDWYVEECRVYYKVRVKVCNNSDDEVCLDNLAFLFNEEYFRVIDINFTNTVLGPNDCYPFDMLIEASQFMPSSTISFQLFDECHFCTTDFSIDLMPDIIECEMAMQSLDYGIIDISNSAAVYFDFVANVGPCQNLIAFWSEPPMLFNYWYDGGEMVFGAGMMNYAEISQLAGEDGLICFYAITCEGNILCKRKYCLHAVEFYQLLLDMGIEPRQSTGAMSDNDDEEMMDNSTSPRLMPNPTTGEVNVIGTADEVVEVLVLDLNGRQMATFDRAVNFNISNLSSGIYIVRVKTKHDDAEKVTYLKLVKK